MSQKYSLVVAEPDVKVERVNPVEVYWIKGRERFKRICGSISTFSGNVCTYEAGYRTTHLGRGFCWLHETSTSAAAWNLIIHQGDNAPDRPLVRYLQAASGITSHQLKDLDGDLMLLHALVGQIQDNKSTLQPSDVEQIRKIIGDIIRAKETKAKIERDVKFEAGSIREFVNQVFSIIVSQLDPATSRRIMNLIMDKVIIPMEATDRITGDVNTIHSSVHALQAESEKNASSKKGRRSIEH